MRARKLRSEAVLEHVLHLNEADVLPTGRAIDAFILKLEALAVEPGVGAGEHFRRARCIFWCSFFRFLVLIRRHADPAQLRSGCGIGREFFGRTLGQKQNPSVLAPDWFDNVLGLGLQKSEPFSEALIFSYPRSRLKTFHSYTQAWWSGLHSTGSSLKTPRETHLAQSPIEKRTPCQSCAPD
jgi:hypothetical protein